MYEFSLQISTQFHCSKQDSFHFCKQHFTSGPYAQLYIFIITVCNFLKKVHSSCFADCKVLQVRFSEGAYSQQSLFVMWLIGFPLVPCRNFYPHMSPLCKAKWNVFAFVIVITEHFKLIGMGGIERKIFLAKFNCFLKDHYSF